MNKTKLTAAIALIIGAVSSPTYAIDTDITSMKFPGQGVFEAQGQLRGTADNMGHMESVDNFFGNPWSAAGVAYFEEGNPVPLEDNNTVADEGNVTNNVNPASWGTFTQSSSFDSGSGMYTWTGTSRAGPGANLQPFTYVFPLAPNEVAWGTLFNWNGNQSIPVLNVMDCTNPNACTGVRGTPMVNGPFNGSDPTFDNSGPTTKVTIELAAGNAYECSEYDGSVITAAVNITSKDTSEILSVDWLLDGDYISSGNTISVFVPLDAHTLSVAVDTAASGILRDDESITVRDSTPPELDIQYIDSRSGEQITSVPSKGKHNVSINYNAIDICDPVPTVSGVATAVHLINDGDTMIIKKQLVTSAVNVFATAVDESGNEKRSEALLPIVDYYE